MSACISRHGFEFSSHVFDADHVCARCGVLDADALIAELNRLKANQMPDGGEWRTQWSYHGEIWWNERTDPRMGVQRVVWHGPITSVSKSKPSDNPAESTTEQTTPNVA